MGQRCICIALQSYSTGIANEASVGNGLYSVNGIYYPTLKGEEEIDPFLL